MVFDVLRNNSEPFTGGEDGEKSAAEEWDHNRAWEDCRLIWMRGEFLENFWTEKRGIIWEYGKSILRVLEEV